LSGQNEAVAKSKIDGSFRQRAEGNLPPYCHLVLFASNTAIH